MKAIHKQVIRDSACTISIPTHANVLDYQIQNDVVCVWYEFNIDEEGRVPLQIKIVGTGQCFELGQFMSWMKTVQQDGYVWHIYDNSINL